MTSRSSIPAAHKHLRRGLLVCALTAACSGALAQTSVNEYGLQHRGSVIADDVLYSIGGGRAISMTGAANMRSIGVGVGWNSNLICGDMSLTTTLQNQLNGITNGFQTIMSNVIQNATSAVASLPALIIQRADPVSGTRCGTASSWKFRPGCWADGWPTWCFWTGERRSRSMFFCRRCNLLTFGYSTAPGCRSQIWMRPSVAAKNCCVM